MDFGIFTATHITHTYIFIRSNKQPHNVQKRYKIFVGLFFIRLMYAFSKKKTINFAQLRNLVKLMSNEWEVGELVWWIGGRAV